MNTTSTICRKIIRTTSAAADLDELTVERFDGEFYPQEDKI